MVDRNTSQQEIRESAGIEKSNLGGGQNISKQYAAEFDSVSYELDATNEVVERLRGILNNTCLHNFEKMLDLIKQLPIDTTERISAVVDLIFEMAIRNEDTSSVMARLCQVLSKMPVTKEGSCYGKSEVRFRNLIINKCQKEFEKDYIEEIRQIRMKKIEICSELQEKLELQDKWNDDVLKLRQRAVGNIRLIGELYKMRILTSPIMMRIIGTLMLKRDEESIECLCVLITIIGKILEVQCAQQAKPMEELEEHFRKIQELSNDPSMSERVGLLLKDVIEMRKQNWISPTGNKNSQMTPRCSRCDSSMDSWRKGIPETCETQQKSNWGPRHNPADVLRVKYPRIYSGNAPILEAKPLGGYSNDSKWNFIDDQSMLHPIDRKYLPRCGKLNVNLDLNKAESKFKDFYQRSETFRNLLLWILNHKDCLVDPSSQRLSVDFITYIGSLISIMKTPYNRREEWSVLATEYKGTIYLINHQINEEVYSENETDSEGEEVEEQTVDKAGLWGHTLEHLLQGGKPEDGVDAIQAYRCIMKTSVGGKTILYAPKMDCVDPGKFDKDIKNMEGFVSIKCCKEVKVEGQRRFQRRVKFNHWWVEHQLLGISRILVGYRNDEGIVHTLEMLETDELPEQARGEWDPNVCTNFLLSFLEFVKRKVKKDCGWTYKFKYMSGGDIQCSKYRDKNYTLPNWFKDKLFREDKTDKGSDL